MAAAGTAVILVAVLRMLMATAGWSLVAVIMLVVAAAVADFVVVLMGVVVTAAAIRTSAGASGGVRCHFFHGYPSNSSITWSKAMAKICPMWASSSE